MNRTEPPPPQHQRLARSTQAILAERQFTGIAVSAGVAIGPVFGTTEPEAVIVKQKIAATEVQAECARLDAARSSTTSGRAA